MLNLFHHWLVYLQGNRWRKNSLIFTMLTCSIPWASRRRWPSSTKPWLRGERVRARRFGAHRWCPSITSPPPSLGSWIGGKDERCARIPHGLVRSSKANINVRVQPLVPYSLHKNLSKQYQVFLFFAQTFEKNYRSFSNRFEIKNLSL